ncbi:ABC transporter ATP-binding protein [Lachnoclostridium phytofermentans]|uniref:ABC transporter related n=1 Tax=Lachnoclostridium phytofermentans (strain ATCC 700394 / DSM 18823 / ISDg) TaxID=357809 RepID=A9KJ89_LACP7|nr:ABC transporter ATP-binding protein [Lachnoclostridium phytofermentans]ABX42501.1 ABC transporter related [Lachnoclostridium phytofermentans ISDg]
MKDKNTMENENVMANENIMKNKNIRKNKNSLGSVLYKIMSASKWMIFLTVLIITGTIATALFPPLVLERIVNSLTAQQQIPLYLALTYLGLLAISGLLESGQNVMITKFGQRVTHSLRSEMCAKLKRLPSAYFSQNEPGIITSRFVNDVDVVDSLFTNGIISMFADACKVISILVVIFYKSTGLGIIIILITPLLFAMTRLFQKRTLKAQLVNRVAVGKVNNHVPETIRNIRMIRTLFRQKYMEQKYDDYIEESYQAMDKSNLYDSIYSPIVIFISSCVIAVMMICAAMGGEIQQFFGITVGTAVAIIAYVSKVFEPLESIGMEIQNIQSAVAGVKRINEFLQEPEREETDSSIAKDIKKFTINTESNSCICFDHVGFSYDNDNIVLSDLRFTVESGESVTLVGRTGAGKSTIFRLLMGLYCPNEGRILVNGIDAAKIPDDQKRKLFGYVEQSFHMVSGTVAEQISLFDPSIGRNQVEAAARLVGLHESIMELTDGYDTPAEKISFSQGQLQLLSIARAVVAAPKILLLDEITANLDSDTERRILDALDRATQGRTVLSISHRFHEHTQNQRTIQIVNPSRGI